MKVKQEKGRGGDPETGVREVRGRSRGDPGKIHRSKGFGVQGVRWEGVGAEGEVTRIRAKGGLGRRGRG